MKGRARDGRMAYQNVEVKPLPVNEIISGSRYARVILPKKAKATDGGIFGPKMYEASGDAITYFFDEVLALRVLIESR